MYSALEVRDQYQSFADYVAFYQDLSHAVLQNIIQYVVHTAHLKSYTGRYFSFYRSRLPLSVFDFALPSHLLDRGLLCRVCRLRR